MLTLVTEDYLYPFKDNLNTRLGEYEDTLIKDSSAYVFVDGEEGDYGVINYYLPTGELVYSHLIHGGDVEEIILTDLGKNEVKRMLLDCIEFAFSETGFFNK